MEEVIESIKKLENLVLCTTKQILNIEELCAFIGLSKSTIYKLTMGGKIPHYKQAKHLYFDRVEIEGWLKANRGYNVDEIQQEASSSILNDRREVA